MNRRFPLWLAPLTLLLLGGCRAAPPPETAVGHDHGVVRAGDREEAQRVSAFAEALIPKVRDLVPDTNDRDVEVWVQPDIELIRGEPYPEHIAGMADFRNARVHLRDNDKRVELHLTHELVHVLLGESWQALPGVLEEGLCDVVAARLVPELGREHHVKRLVEASSFFGGFEAIMEVVEPRTSDQLPPRIVAHRLRMSFDRVSEKSAEEALALADSEVFNQAVADDSVGLYGLGYLVVVAVVDRVGFEGLRQLCLAAEDKGHDHMPLDWILKLIGADNDAIGYRRLIQYYMGPLCIDSLAELLTDSFAQAAVEIGHDMPGIETADQFLDRAQPRLGLPYHPARLSLEDVESFRAAVKERW